jgi:hypothetical protein
MYFFGKKFKQQTRKWKSAKKGTPNPDAPVGGNIPPFLTELSNNILQGYIFQPSFRKVTLVIDKLK